MKFKGVPAGLKLGFSGPSVNRFQGVDGPVWALFAQRGDKLWEGRSKPMLCPYGQRGDLLWVRETWNTFAEDDCKVRFRADGVDGSAAHGGTDMPGGATIYKWRSSLHMPRWASRLTLKLTDVRVERVQDISAEDCFAEGIERSPWGASEAVKHGEDPVDHGTVSPRVAFRALWNDTNGTASWTRNDWVWALTFEPYLLNVDGFIRAWTAHETGCARLQHSPIARP